MACFVGEVLCVGQGVLKGDGVGSSGGVVVAEEGGVEGLEG